MIELDGSTGEGGGQIVRSALSLAILTGQPFRIRKIRAGRPKPGLQAQHLTAVKAAAEISGAEVDGERLGSRSFVFQPGAVIAGEYVFSIGTAGSAALVLQTVLPPLLTAAGPSRLVLEGGTHNTHAPPFEHLARSLLPLLATCGPRIVAELETYGFYPRGGGRFVVTIEPGPSRAFELLTRQGTARPWAQALVARLPDAIGTRELDVVRQRLGWTENLEVVSPERASCPANALIGGIDYDNFGAVWISHGERGLPAERVADRFADDVEAYAALEPPVEEHLADQLLVPLGALAGGRYRTIRPSSHLTTNLETFNRFAPVPARVVREEDPENPELRPTWRVEVPPLRPAP